MTIAVSSDEELSSPTTGSQLSALGQGGAASLTVPMTTPWALLATLCFGHLALDCCTGIWPVFKTLAHLDLAESGLIATLGALAGNGLQLVFGVLADRGWRRVLLLVGLFFSGAVTAVSLTDQPIVHLLMVLATYVGSAAFHPSGAGAAGAVSAERKGTFMALFLAGGYVGYAFSQMAFTAVYRWQPQATLVLWALPVVAALGTFRWGPRRRAGAAKSLGELRGAVRREARRLLPLLTVQLFATALSLALIFLLPDLLMTREAPRWLVEGGGHAALVVGGCLALLPSGYLADRFGARWVLVGANLLTGLALLILLRASAGPGALLVAIILFGLFNGANTVVAVSEGNRIFPREGSSVSALLMGLPWCLAAGAPALAGAFADPATGGSPPAAIARLGLLIPLTVVAAFLIPGRR